jgi:hypothetical protein
MILRLSKHPLFFSDHGASFIFPLIDRHIMDARRTTTLRSKVIRLASVWVAFARRICESKADYAAPPGSKILTGWLVPSQGSGYSKCGGQANPVS